jgi:purine nucleoside phosphorylase
MSDQVQRLRDHRAETGIILGSGLNSLVGDPAKQQMIPYAPFSEIPQPSVPGHPGRFVLGEVEKTKIILLKGAFIFTKDIQRAKSHRLFA